jgi:hypothetical protein
MNLFCYRQLVVVSMNALLFYALSIDGMLLFSCVAQHSKICRWAWTEEGIGICEGKKNATWGNE